ncbi:MAG: tRNA 2-thiouridine(34) synthase MnmA [Nannocystaceae bacterium]
MRVVCAMSGGVDSSVAASVLVEEGHEVVGMTMSLYDAPPRSPKARGGTCCSPAEVDQAKQVCEQLGIAHYTLDERDRFRTQVIDDFARAYAVGRTPNPCARCNEHVKFGPLLVRAQALGAQLLVTGHYARVQAGRLRRGADASKDQSYFLFAMGRDALSRVRFPLGAWHKQDVRKRARELGLPNADAPDSQELCFVSGGDYARAVEDHLGRLGEGLSRLDAGDVRDEAGRVIGKHRGIHRVTVGQRRGLGISAAEPQYVLRVLPAERAVVVGPASSLRRETLGIEGFRKLADLPTGATFEALVQFRHRSPPVPASVTVYGEAAHVVFNAPVHGVAAGQAAVIYDGDCVLGGGWIASEVDRSHATHGQRRPKDEGEDEDEGEAGPGAS